MNPRSGMAMLQTCGIHGQTATIDNLSNKKYKPQKFYGKPIIHGRWLLCLPLIALFRAVTMSQAAFTKRCDLGIISNHWDGHGPSTGCLFGFLINS
jgi:hypothetical protein